MQMSVLHVLVMATCLCLTSGQLMAQDRVALLVGNWDYGDQKLPHVQEDLQSLAKSLSVAGFSVTVKENAEKVRRNRDLASFARTCPDGGISLVYFAGFGSRIQEKQTQKIEKDDGTEEKVVTHVWRNGFQPFDEPPRDAVWLSDMAEVFSQESTARLHLLLFDCGVGNQEVPAEQRGLGEVDAARFPSTVICYASPPGQVLPKGTRSRLAASFARHIGAKGRSIEQVISAVRDDVARQSDGKQQIWFEFSHPLDRTVEVVPSRQRTIHTTKLPPDRPQPGDEWINGLGMVFCWVPPGTFQMGIDDPQSPQAEDAQPVEVTISEGFWIGKYEMAAGTYRRLGKGPKGEPVVRHSNVPLTFANGPTALDMAKKIVGKEKKAVRVPDGWEYRLPTEAEWEYACRAGGRGKFSFGDSVDQLHRYGNYADRSLHQDDSTFYYADLKNDDGNGLRLAALGSYLPNAWGIHDMHGNVAEYCLDRYSPVLPGGVDPLFRGEGNKQIVFRGGGWCSKAEYCLAGFRHARRVSHNDRGRSHIGLRMVLAKKRPQGKKK